MILPPAQPHPLFSRIQEKKKSLPRESEEPGILPARQNTSETSIAFPYVVLWRCVCKYVRLRRITIGSPILTEGRIQNHDLSFQHPSVHESAMEVLRSILNIVFSGVPTRCRAAAAPARPSV